MSKARDLANAGTALTTVSATELGYLDGVTSAVQTQINAQIPKSTVTAKGDILVATGSGTIVRQGVGTDGQFLQAASAQADGVQWATVSQYALPSQTGNAGRYLTTNGTSESWGTVNQPLTWTQRLAPTGVSFSNVEYNGSNMYVAVGASGQLYSSPDGITWTSRTSGFGTSQINDVAFGNGIWVAVGGDGKISSSPDGITWTARTANMGTNMMFKVHFANNTWVAVGGGGGTTNTGGITVSSDGLTWTRKSQSLSTGSTEYNSVIFNGTSWIVGTTSGSNTNYLYSTTSNPSGNWATGGMAPNTTGIIALFYDGSKTIINMDNTNWYFTNSGTILSDVLAYQFPNFTSATQSRNVKLYAGSIYQEGTYRQSFVAGTNIRPSLSAVQLSPFATMNSNSTIGSRMSTFGIFPAGAIVCSQQGSIVTSF
jgi:hypothetical protein